ncbi:M23 family metallopeptidase [Angelakisella massiliensis]|uniref:M23 family metallopeptidase n=1 Tax=Angelakisella massiliensis TaxID=1871018 RepID=UPI0023A87F4C|nr:M23 family metallopeptidase [Angelakisella massiliensis]
MENNRRPSDKAVSEEENEREAPEQQAQQQVASGEAGEKKKKVKFSFSRLGRLAPKGIPFRKKDMLPTKEEQKEDTSGLSGRYLEWVYHECYYIGMQLIRDVNDFKRLIQKAFIWLWYTIPPILESARRRVVTFFDRIAGACLAPFDDITLKTKTLGKDLRAGAWKKEGEKKPGPLRLIAGYFHSLGRPLNQIANFIAPIIGCTILAAVILYFDGIDYALEVEYSGQKLGCIASESDFYEAQNMVLDRLLEEEYLAPEDSKPSFRLVIANEDSLIDTDTLANKILSASRNEVEQADGIYIDGQFLGAVEDGTEFLFYIDSILESYRTGTEHELVQFVKKVALREGVYPVSSIKSVFEIKNSLESNKDYQIDYQVLPGDTLESVAQANNTTVESLMELNPQLESRLDEDAEEGQLPRLWTGETLTVARFDLSLGIQVTRRETYTEELDYEIEYVDDNRYPEGYVETISMGVAGEQTVVSDITYIDGEKVDENRISVTVTKEPVNAQQRRGTLRPSQYLTSSDDTSANFIWPVDGGYMSAGLYGYYGHTGMDIACSQGTAIRASRAGYVTYASNYSNGAYGKRVDISHGNGVMTRYAHCSQVLVAPGDYVEQGQLIALVGRTGNATGNHCHFEIRINGQIMNPANYIGTYYPGR